MIFSYNALVTVIIVITPGRISTIIRKFRTSDTSQFDDQKLENVDTGKTRTHILITFISKT